MYARADHYLLKSGRGPERLRDTRKNLARSEKDGSRDRPRQCPQGYVASRHGRETSAQDRRGNRSAEHELSQKNEGRDNIVDDEEIPARIRVDDRVVSGVAVSVKGLGVIGGLDNRIRGKEFAQNWIVEPGAVIVEAELVIVFMVGGGVVEAGQEGIGTFARQPFLVQISKNEGIQLFKTSYSLITATGGVSL